MNHSTTRAERYGAAISALLERRGMSKRELAAATGIPFTTLWRTLEGRRAVDVDDLGFIADSLGVRPSEIDALANAEQEVA